VSVMVLILAAGEQKRWKMTEPSCKQLLDAGGETILARIQRQCKARNHTPIVVTHKPELASSLCFNPEQRRWTVETLWATREIWAGRVVVLLGDTVYSNDAIDRIFSERTDELRVFGNEYEIFALSFLTPYDKIIATLEQAIKHAESGVAKGGGKLRKFYQIWCGLDPNTSQIENCVLHSMYDAMDVDCAHDYEGLKKWVKAGLE
jgi:hypothetical protein